MRINKKNLDSFKVLKGTFFEYSLKLITLFIIFFNIYLCIYPFEFAHFAHVSIYFFMFF